METRIGRRKSSGKLGFVFYPIVFALLGAILFITAFTSVVGPFSDILSLVFSDEAIDFEKEAADIFNEVSEDNLPSGNEVISVPGELIPGHGERFGRIVIEKANVDAPLYYGDSERELLLGVGSYTGPGAYIPGSGRTVLLGAHNNLFFGEIGNLMAGDKINITTTYGKYVYEVKAHKIAADTDTSAYDLTREDENLILYTCYPFDALGLTEERYFVYADYVSGPELDVVIY